MRVRRPAADGNTPCAKSRSPGAARRRGLLSLRDAVILAGGLAAAAGAGVLAYLVARNLAAAALAAAPAFAGTVTFLNTLID